MAALINAVYPSYNNTSNYSGVNSAVRSSGLVTNPEHYDTVIGLERTGQLGLSQFGFIKLPREVLFLQDDRSAKVKSPTVSSSTETTSDEDRQLAKVDDHNATTPAPVTAKKDNNSKPDAGITNGAPPNPGEIPPPTADDGHAPPAQTARAAIENTEHHADTLLAQTGAAHPHTGHAEGTRRKDEHKSARGAPNPKAPSLLGKGNAVYLGVIASSSGRLSGRNVSVLA